MKFETILAIIRLYKYVKFHPNPRRDKKVIKGQIFPLGSMGVDFRF
jgi:hypothetical protein